MLRNRSHNRKHLSQRRRAKTSLEILENRELLTGLAGNGVEISDDLSDFEAVVKVTSEMEPGDYYLSLSDDGVVTNSDGSLLR